MSWKRAGAAVLTLLAIVGLIYWQVGGFKEKVAVGEQAPSGLQSSQGSLILAAEITIPVVEEAVGTLQSRHRVDVSPRIQAVITEIKVNANDKVREGDLLAALDPRDLDARVGQAEQTVNAAAANLQQAQADYARTSELLQRKVASAQEADNARLRVEVTSASLGEARRGLEQARVARSYAEIRSPVSGVVVEKKQNSGDMAVPGQPILSLYDPSLLRLEAPVRESVARRLRIGGTLRVRIGSDGKETTATVDEIVPQADIASRSLLVKVLVPNVPDLYTGMYGRLLISTGSEKALVVPVSAVERHGQLEFVSVFRDGKVNRRFVQTGRRFGEQIEILAGLSAGETIARPSTSGGA